MCDHIHPLISVVVPVLNERHYLPECLASLLSQDYEPARWELLVVDGGSDDGTAQIAAQTAACHPQVRVLPNPERLVSCGRNVGIRHARGKIIAFVEGHAFVEPGFLATIERGFARDEVQCLGRWVEQQIDGDTSIQQATGLLRKSLLGRNPHSLRFTSGELASADPLTIATVYRRQVFDKVGLFDETLATNEDVELNWRVREAGLRALRPPGLRYHLHPRATVRGFLKQMYRYGYGKALLVRKHARAFRPAYAAPTGVLAFALVGAVWSLARVCLLPLLAYVALSACTALARPVRGAHGYPCLRILLSLAMLTGFGAGFAMGLLGPRSRARRGTNTASAFSDTGARWAEGRGEGGHPS